MPAYRLMGDEMGNATYIDRLLVTWVISTPIFTLIGNDSFSSCHFSGWLLCGSDSELQVLVRSKNKYHSCKIETGFLWWDIARVICFFSRIIQQLGFWTQKLKPTSTAARSGAAPSALRAALDSSIQAYAQTLVWPRRDVPRRFTWIFFNKASGPSTMSCCSVCTLAWYVATKDARWVHCSSCSLRPSPRRPTPSCSLAAVRRGDCVRASWLYL